MIKIIYKNASKEYACACRTVSNNLKIHHVDEHNIHTNADDSHPANVY